MTRNEIVLARDYGLAALTHICTKDVQANKNRCTEEHNPLGLPYFPMAHDVELISNSFFTRKPTQIKKVSIDIGEVNGIWVVLKPEPASQPQVRLVDTEDFPESDLSMSINSNSESESDSDYDYEMDWKSDSDSDESPAIGVHYPQ